MAMPINFGRRGRPGASRRPARMRDDGLTRQQRRERDDKTAAWAFVWILFGFKAVTAVIIWLVAARSSEATSILAGTHWFWLILPLVAVAGPLVYQLRVRRVRRRRVALQRAEWLVEQPATVPTATAPLSPEARRAALQRAEWMLD